MVRNKPYEEHPQEPNRDDKEAMVGVNSQIEQDLGKLRKALYLYEMNKVKPRTKPETMLRLQHNVLEAALRLFERNDNLYWDYQEAHRGE
jgi:hypothetical protein